MKFRTLLAAAVSAVLLSSCASQPEWTPAGDRIMTSWGENLDPENVLQEYPRPQLVRDRWINLNGLWEYAITPADAVPEEEVETGDNLELFIKHNPVVSGVIGGLILLISVLNIVLWVRINRIKHSALRRAKKIETKKN